MFKGAPTHSATGILLGLAAAFAFGAGGAFVKPLLESGWSPGAAVFARVAVAAVALLVPGLFALRFDLRPLWRARWVVLIYAAVAVAGTQLAFYAAIARIPVSIALLIEYLAPVLLVALVWVRTRRVPQWVVIAGTVISMSGLVLVIGPGGGDLDTVGVIFAVIAMLGVAVYYAIGGHAAKSVHPVALAAAGFFLGAILLALAGLIGLVPLSAHFGDVGMLGLSVPWFIPLVLVGLIATAFAYVAGLAAITRLGARLASFLGLFEVVFAAIVAWLMLGEALGISQILGGVLILAGVLCIRLEKEDLPGPEALSPDAVQAGGDADRFGTAPRNKEL